MVESVSGVSAQVVILCCATFYFFGCLPRTAAKYMTAKAASNTPPNIKIKVVTIARLLLIRKKSRVGLSAANLLTRRRLATGDTPLNGRRHNKKRFER